VLAQRQRAYAHRIANGDHHGFGEEGQGIGAVHGPQSICHTVGQQPFARTGDEVENNFRVSRGLENRALVLEVRPPFRRINQIAVVGDGQRTT